jgi:hypothetical protein
MYSKKSEDRTHFAIEIDTIMYEYLAAYCRTKERLHWKGPAAYTRDRPVLSSERAPHKNKNVIAKQ